MQLRFKKFILVPISPNRKPLINTYYNYEITVWLLASTHALTLPFIVNDDTLKSLARSISDLAGHPLDVPAYDTSIDVVLAAVLGLNLVNRHQLL